MIANNINAVNVKQINIAPTLSNFPVAANQAKFYEQYRAARVKYTIMPLDVVNQTQGANTLDLVYVYTAPITTPSIPTVSEDSYLAFKNV
jgi:hypothetical protein